MKRYYCSDIPYTESGAITTSFLQAVAVVVERLVQTAWGVRGKPVPRRWHRIVGYIWTWSFLQ
jgi:hypothetical protein